MSEIRPSLIGLSSRGQQGCVPLWNSISFFLAFRGSWQSSLWPLPVSSKPVLLSLSDHPSPDVSPPTLFLLPCLLFKGLCDYIGSPYNSHNFLMFKSLIFFEVESCYVAQTDLECLDSSDSIAPVS